MAGLPPRHGGCGVATVRVTPRAPVQPCVYWPGGGAPLDVLLDLGREVVATPAFEAARFFFKDTATTVIYTAVAPPANDSEATLRDGVHTWRETQCLAVAQDDDLRTWKKLPEPVIAAPPPGLAVTRFRDPYIWREAKNWMLTLGSGVHDKGGMVLLYTSPDLRRWTYLHPLVEGSASNIKTVNPVETGDMWECPDFFPLGDKHVLLISTMGKVHWKVGTYAKQRFTPEKEGMGDWGSYYAAKTMLDANGNRILWGWITETRSDA